MDNKRKIGDDLEDRVLKKLGPGFTLNGNSGATFSNGDIRHRNLVVECKVKNSTEGFTSPLAELKKLWALAKKECKDWLYIEQNQDNKIMVLVEFDAFLEMTEDWRKKQVTEPTFKESDNEYLNGSYNYCQECDASIKPGEGYCKSCVEHFRDTGKGSNSVGLIWLD